MALSNIINTWPPTPAILGGALIAGYPVGKIGQDGITATRQVIVPWDKLDEAIEFLQPPSTFSGGAQVIRYGAQYPGRPFLRVVNINWKPLSNKPTGLDFNGDYKYEHAELTVEYGFLRNQQSGGSGSPDPKDPAPLLIHRWTMGIQTVETDEKGLVWDNVWNRKDPNPFSPIQPVVSSSVEDPGVRRLIGRPMGTTSGKAPQELVTTIEHEITRQRVPRPPFSALRACGGKCNKSIVEFKTGKIPKECLRLWGAKLTSTVMANGEDSWEMNLQFGERQVIAEDQLEPGGWNHYYRTADSEEVTKGTGFVFGLSRDATTGRRGYYRLEKSYGKGAIKYGTTVVPPVPASGFEGTDLKQGYNEETALVPQRDFSKLWLPEPVPGVGP